MRPLSIDVAPSAPELPVPVFEFQIPKLLVKHPTAFPFQISHKAGYAHFGRALHKHMDMICAAYSFHNPYTFPLTQLSQNTAYCSTPLSVEYLSSVYWRKNDVIFTVPLGVRPHSPPFLLISCLTLAVARPQGVLTNQKVFSVHKKNRHARRFEA